MTPSNHNFLKIWYWSGAVLVFLILVVGGITRLTGSGLSMTDWKPIMGAIPPLTEQAWSDAFEQYKLFPEYREVNRGMSLSDFQFIFFWEYIHRMLGRLIGLVFIIPFGWFLIRGTLDTRQFRRALLLLGLGALQGLMGWYMVQSGLVDVPRVSTYRLAAHLLLAFLIFGSCVWFALDLKSRRFELQRGAPELRNWLRLFLVLFLLQVLWGAFVAGLHAGHVYNTFPKMYQYWFPPELWVIEPFILDLFENIVTVQWLHRLLGTLLGLLGIVIWARSFQTETAFQTKKWSLILLAVLLGQYMLGVYTLLYHVPLWLGVAHQAAAMILLGVLLGFLHHLKPSHRLPYAH